MNNINKSSDDILDSYYCSDYGDAIDVEGVDSQEDYDYKNMEWYVNAVKARGQIVYTELYYDEDMNVNIATASKAIFDKDNNEFLGVFGIDIELSALQEYMNNISILRTGYAIFMNNSGELLVDSDKNKFNIKSMLNQEFWEKAKVDKSGIYSMNIDGAVTLFFSATAPFIFSYFYY